MSNPTPIYQERWHDWFTSRLHHLGHTNATFGDLIGRGATHVSSYRQQGGHLPPSTMFRLVADALLVDEAQVRQRIAQERAVRANEEETRPVHASGSTTTGAA